MTILQALESSIILGKIVTQPDFAVQFYEPEIQLKNSIKRLPNFTVLYLSEGSAQLYNQANKSSEWLSLTFAAFHFNFALHSEAFLT